MLLDDNMKRNGGTYEIDAEGMLKHAWHGAPESMGSVVGGREVKVWMFGHKDQKRA